MKDVKIAYGVIALLMMVATSCKQSPLEVRKVIGAQQKIDTTIVADKSIDSIIQPYRNHINKNLDAVMAYAPADLLKTDGKLESSLGNFMADAAWARTKSYFFKVYKKNLDMVLFNYGGMRSPILKGNVSRRSAFQLMPFENELVVVELSYEKMTELSQYLLKAKKAHPVAGIVLEIDKEKDEISKFLIDGKPLQKGETYFVLTTDYLQQGGDRMNFLADPVSLTRVKYKLRNALIDYFMDVDTLSVTLDRRMRYAE